MAVCWHRLIETQLIVFSVFIIFYCYVLGMLITSKQKLIKSSYFTIFIYTGIVDIILFLGDQYFNASYRIGLGPHLEFLVVIASTITGVNFSLHVFGNFLRCLCQYTAVCWPHLYDRMWSFRRTSIYLSIATVLGIGAYTENWWMKNKYVQLEDGCWDAWTISDHSLPIAYLFPAFQMIIYVLVGAFAIWRMFIALKDIGIASKQLKRHHRGLALVTLFDCLIFCVDLIYELEGIFGREMYPPDLLNFLDEYFSIFYSVMYTSNAIILVLFSKAARQEVFRMFVKRTQQGPESTIHRKITPAMSSFQTTNSVTVL